MASLFCLNNTLLKNANYGIQSAKISIALEIMPFSGKCQNYSSKKPMPLQNLINPDMGKWEIQLDKIYF